MLSKRRRLRAQDFPSQPVFSGGLLRVAASANNSGYNRYAVVVSARRIKSAAERHTWKRRVLARAEKFPEAGTDFLFVLLARPKSGQALDTEFDRIKTRPNK